MEWVDITAELRAAPTGWDLYRIVMKYWDVAKTCPRFKIDNQGRIFRRGA